MLDESGSPSPILSAAQAAEPSQMVDTLASSDSFAALVRPYRVDVNSALRMLSCKRALATGRYRQRRLRMRKQIARVESDLSFATG
jgi:hypothetical protein